MGNPLQQIIEADEEARARVAAAEQRLVEQQATARGERERLREDATRSQLAALSLEPSSLAEQLFARLLQFYRAAIRAVEGARPLLLAFLLLRGARYDVTPFRRPLPFLAGLWRLSDPKITIASAVPFCVAVALAYEARGAVDGALAMAAFLAIFLVEVGKNAVNDLVDCRSGADLALRDEERSPFSGGKRVLVEHLLTEREVVVIAWVAFAAAGVTGLAVAMQSRMELLLLGAVAAAVAVAYSAAPFRLSYRGLGEVAVLLVYGPGIIMGGVLLLGGDITREVVVVSLAAGLLIANVLLANEIPDERVDRLAGKKTLVVRLGMDRAVTLIETVFMAAYALPLLAVFYGEVPFRAMAFAAGMPLAILAVDLLRRGRQAGPPVVAQALTIGTYALSGLAYAAAVAL